MAARALRAQPVLSPRSCAALCITLCHTTRQSVCVILDSCCNAADSPPEKHYSDATRIILPEVQKRKERAEEKTLAAGGKPPKTSDTIGWMVEMARGKQIDYVDSQLSLTVAAIHVITEALTSALVDLTYPGIIPQLREEIIQLMSEHGWSKQALYQMKLMDSFLKESQGLHPVSLR